ncbi:MAG: S-methyl-5-thioribose-1-phosphate isomerase [Planctomycetaceae bacterium]
MTQRPPPTLCWQGDAATGVLRMIDQTLLPGELREIECDSVETVREAIRSLRVRGAPAIGVAASYGFVIGMQSTRNSPPGGFREQIDAVIAPLASSRPTAVNLFWSLDRMRSLARSVAEQPGDERLKRLLAEARAIEHEDREMCAAIGRHGAELLADGDGIVTHCNAGGLATAGDGTALSVIFAAAAQGKTLQVYADETRPLLQGARLTAWELQQRNVSVTVIADSTAGWVMKRGRIQAVITGADRIAANGDTANKIGTYSVALLAGAHGIPFYVAAPSSTFDRSSPSGETIPIEERPAEEISRPFGRQTVPEGVNVYNPAFDVTPAEHIAAIITERGLIRPVNADRVAEVLDR